MNGSAILSRLSYWRTPHTRHFAMIKYRKLRLETAELQEIMTLKEAAKFLWENRKNKQQFYVTETRRRSYAPVLVKPWGDDELNIKVNYPREKPKYARNRKEVEAILADLFPRENDVAVQPRPSRKRGPRRKDRHHMFSPYD